MLAREQRVERDAGLRGELAEAASLELVGDEHVPLLFGQLVERRVELVEEDGARVGGFGPASGEGSRSSSEPPRLGSARPPASSFGNGR